MGKKKERCSKRKRRALLIEQCANMTKKRKQSLEHCSENKAIESTSDCNNNPEGIQDNTLLQYAELQNVLPANSQTADKNISHNEDIPVAILGTLCSSDNVSTEMTVDPTTEAPIEDIYQPKSMLDWTSSEKTFEDSSDRKIEPEVQDVGHRIIDVSHFVKELVKFSEHKSLFDCGLAPLKLESEHHVSLQSEFTYVCSLCGFKKKIKSSLADVNKDAVAGVMAAGCGHAQLNQFSAGIGLPNMSDFTYNKMQNDICNDLEETAWDEMKNAGEREKDAAIKEGRVNKDGIPLIDVIVDGCWCKRSYRTNYAALSGAAAIIGRRFGQVLYMCVKNKYCCICARAEKKKETPKEHTCYKNFSGASTAMESTIITEGFQQSIEMHGLIYSRFIADGDSSTYAKIINARPYPGITVAKIYCRNHLLRNYCNKLQQLSSNTQFIAGNRKKLTQQKILRSRKYICDAIKLHKETKNEDGLYKDINASVFHAFNIHANCNRQLCKHMGPDAPNPFFGSLLWQKIKTVAAQLADKAHSLIEDVDSNVVERFNGVIAKLVGGKRINYAQRRSYQARCAGALISFNTGKLLSTVQRNVYGTSPRLSIKKHENAINEKRLKAKLNTRKKNRTLVPRTLNLDYGEVLDTPDMDKDTFEKAKKTFVQNLSKTDAERKEIEKRTILQSESGEWLELRRNMLTASNFGKIIKRKQTNSCQNTVKNLLYKPSIDHVQSISHGKKYEKIALEQLSSMQKIKIEKCGLFIDEKYNFLGATPDGIAASDMIVEIKCPIAPFKNGIEDAIQNNKMHFYKNKNGEVVINQKSDWYFQIQGQLHICKKKSCLLGIWYGNDKIKTELIEKDDAFWEREMEPKLIKFYYDCLLPELVDPRHTRNKPIRDPIYVNVHKNKNPVPDTGIEQNQENKENILPDKTQSDTNIEYYEVHHHLPSVFPVAHPAPRERTQGPLYEVDNIQNVSHDDVLVSFSDY